MNPIARMTAKAWARSWDRGVRALRSYHDYKVFGLETFPRRGGVMVVGTHSLATYETFMLSSVALESLGRRPYILADDLLCGIPVLGDALAQIGIVPGKRDAAKDILRRGDLLGVGPGGMREALRPSRDRYQIDWRGRRGFVWVALQAGVPIVLAACPRADDIFHVYGTPITPWLYDKMHAPLPIFRGIGPTPLPKPVEVWHVLSEPIVSEVRPEEVTEADVDSHHAYLVERMHDLMHDGLTKGP